MHLSVAELFKTKVITRDWWRNISSSRPHSRLEILQLTNAVHN